MTTPLGVSGPPLRRWAAPSCPAGINARTGSGRGRHNPGPPGLGQPSCCLPPLPASACCLLPASSAQAPPEDTHACLLTLFPPAASLLLPSLQGAIPRGMDILAEIKPGYEEILSK